MIMEIMMESVFPVRIAREFYAPTFVRQPRRLP